MTNPLPAQILVDIIRTEMALPPNAVWVRDQNFKIPNDYGIYVIAGMVTSKPIGSESYVIEGPTINWDMPGATWDMPNSFWDENSLIEVQEMVAREQHQIDILSRSNDALSRNWEILAALKSIYGQQQQEKYFMKICRLPNSFLNTSYAEGGSQLNRYSLIFDLFAIYRKSKVLPYIGDAYYTDFTARVDTEQTIGTNVPAIEFEINSQGIVT